MNIGLPVFSNDPEQRRLFWAKWKYRHYRSRKQAAKWNGWVLLIGGIVLLPAFGLGLIWIIAGRWAIEWSKKPIPREVEIAAKPRLTALEYLRAEEARLSEWKKQ